LRSLHTAITTVFCLRYYYSTTTSTNETLQIRVH